MRSVRLLALVLPVVGVGSLSAQQAGPPAAVILSGPEVGQRAPDFSLRWARADSIGPVDDAFRLRDARGQVVVIAFYPRDFTPTSTAQFRLFAERFEDLFGPEVVVVGISTDSLATHARFAASLNLPFALLTDLGQQTGRRYGSAGPDGEHRRTVYLVGRDGRVAYRDMRFTPGDMAALSRLREAVARARDTHRAAR